MSTEYGDIYTLHTTIDRTALDIIVVMCIQYIYMLRLLQMFEVSPLLSWNCCKFLYYIPYKYTYERYKIVLFVNVGFLFFFLFLMSSVRWVTFVWLFCVCVCMGVVEKCDVEHDGCQCAQHENGLSSVHRISFTELCYVSVVYFCFSLTKSMVKGKTHTKSGSSIHLSFTFESYETLVTNSCILYTTVNEAILCWCIRYVCMCVGRFDSSSKNIREHTKTHTHNIRTCRGWTINPSFYAFIQEKIAIFTNILLTKIVSSFHINTMPHNMLTLRTSFQPFQFNKLANENPLPILPNP